MIFDNNRAIKRMPTTRNRVRYKRAAVNRFAVHDNRGPVLGYVVRTPNGYEIENRFYDAPTMKGILVHFRTIDLAKARK
jgi:hypothetical protein